MYASGTNEPADNSGSENRGQNEDAPRHGATLGTQIWFNVPMNLIMLGLGVMAIPLAVSFDTSRAALYARALLGIYASGVALNLLDAIVRVRRNSARSLLLRWRGSGSTAIYNFLLDLAFVVGIIVFDRRDEQSIIVLLLMLTGARFLAHVVGQPRPRLWKYRVPVVWLPAIIPAIFWSLQDYYTPDGQPVRSSSIIVEVTIISILLPLLYALLINLNKRIAEQSQLAEALAERDQRLLQSAITAEQDASRLAEQVLRLDLLQDGIRAMNSAIELDDLLLMVVNNAVRVLKAEQSSIGLVDYDTGELVIQCATGVDSATLRRRRFAPGVGVAGWVVQNGKPLTVEDVRMDVRYVDPYRDDTVGRTTRSMLCVPLVAESKVIGTLCVTHSEPGAISFNDQNLLTSFAEQAALAVHKSQLLEERTRQSEELRRRGELIESLHSIGQSVLSSLDLPQVLNTVISRVSELSSFDHASIYLLNERTGETELAANGDGPLSHHPEVLLKPLTTASELWKKALETGATQSCNSDICMMCLPLLNRGKALGFLLLAREGSNPFTRLEEDTAENVAHAATIAIVNARLFTRVSVGQQQTTALYRLMLKVNSASNRRQLSNVICQELRRIIGARSAALLVGDNHAHLSCWATSGDWSGQDLGHIALRAGDPFTSSILTALHQMSAPGLAVVHNVPHEFSHLSSNARCSTIPLVQGGRIYGLLVVEPYGDQPVPEEIKETVSLAVSHSTVALERAELFEQTLSSARQSTMLYSIAAEVQTSLEESTVVQMTINGALEALPIDSCELYTFNDDHTKLQRVGVALSSEADDSVLAGGAETIEADSNATLVQTLHSHGLIIGDFIEHPAQEEQNVSVVLGRLIGSEQTLGVVRLTTALPAEEFVQRHATFCQSLLTHSGGALERSRLYSTASKQAQMLRQRAQQLTDILDLGSLSAADVPFTSLMPRIAADIARSLGFAYVRIGDIGPESSDIEVRASTDQEWGGEGSEKSLRALQVETVQELLAKGEPLGADLAGVYLEESQLAEIVPGEYLPAAGDSKQLILMPLNSTGGEIQGYIMAALRDSAYTTESAESAETTEHDLLEVLSIFSQRVALLIENYRIYSQLLDSKRKMEAVVLSISDGVIVTDAELSVLIHNNLAGHLFETQTPTGYSRHLPWLIHNEDIINLMRDCISESKSDVMDVDLSIGRDLRTYQAVVHPITAPGMGVLGAVLTLRDVTAERAIDRAKSDFLSIVSHELRTPLNSVMGFLDIILMGKTGPLNELQTDFMTTAKQEAIVLQRLINDILDYSQLEGRMLRMEMAPLNLSSVIVRVVNQSVPRMERDELTVINNVPPGLLVVGDEIRLEQVFKNLLDNAAKFTDAGGQIAFECEVNSETVTISVRDNGCGIPPAQLADVFDRFYQAENNSNRQKHQRGLGLGLAICKNIVDAHGGRIWIESELGTGTTLHVELLLFNAESHLYEFDAKTGKATLAAPVLN